MSWIHTFVDIILHLDKHLTELIAAYQYWVYGILFLIVFLETGLVVTPFLPGDSLLFAIGALAASPVIVTTSGASVPNPLHLALVIPLLCLAANCGDLLNYSLGRRLGPAV